MRSRPYFLIVANLFFLACGGGGDDDGSPDIDANVIPLVDAAPPADAPGAVDAAMAVSVCNPITNAGCTTMGSTCDLAQDMSFQCFPPPNDVALCGTCDNAAGPFCAPGSGCLMNKCSKYCCDNGDCGTGTCNLTQVVNGVGICVDAMQAAACDAPAVAPSGGACYTGT